jgi:hypothetical protein
MDFTFLLHLSFVTTAVMRRAPSEGQSVGGRSLLAA